MAFQNFLPFPSAKRCAGRAIAGFSTLLLIGLCGNCLPAAASATRFFLELPIDSSISYRVLTQQAESLIYQTIAQAFRQNSPLESIEVVINTNRNGDVLPLITTVVSRSQWEASRQGAAMPQIRQWSRYYNLYQQFDRPQTIAQSTPVGAAGPAQASNRRTLIFAIDRARDRGELSGEMAQRHLNHLD
jgi:hypothetical protein